MKLFSAAGLTDLANPLNAGFTDTVARRLGILDIFRVYGHALYFAYAVPDKGLVIPQYQCTLGIPLREIIQQYPTGDVWVALGLMLEPLAGSVLPSLPANYFSIGVDPYATATPFPYTRGALFGTHGQNKRLCAELIYKPSTGDYHIYVNGIKRASGTNLKSGSGTPAGWTLNFNTYDQNDTAGRVVLTDYYFGVVNSPDDRLGNFKVTKLMTKTTTLPNAALSNDGTAAVVTGNHDVEFDVAPLANQSVVGMVEHIRAYSVGPTAAVTTTRRVNGVDSAANKVSDIPVTYPATLAAELATRKVSAAPVDYVTGTVPTECKLALSIVNN